MSGTAVNVPMYKEHKKVAVVTHVSDEKSIETEDGDGKLKIQVKHKVPSYSTFFLSVSLFFFLFLSTERSYLTHTLSLLSLHSRGPTESTLYKQKLPFWWENKRPSRPIGGEK